MKSSRVGSANHFIIPTLHEAMFNRIEVDIVNMGSFAGCGPSLYFL